MLTCTVSLPTHSTGSHPRSPENWEDPRVSWPRVERRAWDGQVVKSVNGVAGARLQASGTPWSWQRPSKELQTLGAFCLRAWLCKRWGKGPGFLELVHSLEPPLPAGVTMGEGPADWGLEGLDMRMGTQHALDRTNRFHSLPACELPGQSDSILLIRIWSQAESPTLQLSLQAPIPPVPKSA